MRNEIIKLVKTFNFLFISVWQLYGYMGIWNTDTDKLPTNSWSLYGREKSKKAVLLFYVVLLLKLLKILVNITKVLMLYPDAFKCYKVCCMVIFHHLIHQDTFSSPEM